MTVEQIRQNTWNDLGRYSPCDENEWIDGYVIGTHSRDEEIKELKKSYHEMFYALTQKIERLRNPWISVKDRLPERMTSRGSNGTKIINCCSKDVFGYDAMYNIGRLVCYNHESEMWESHDVYIIGETTHWMPIIPIIQTSKKD